MGRPLERVAPWWEYRERFMTPERVEKGVQLWLDHGSRSSTSQPNTRCRPSTWWRSSA